MRDDDGTLLPPSILLYRALGRAAGRGEM